MHTQHSLAHFPVLARHSFIRFWLHFADIYGLSHLQYTAPIATLGAPALGNVDGTHAVDLSSDSGFLFLFNPNMIALNISLVIDENIGISNASAGSMWSVAELYPRQLPNISLWSHGQTVSIEVGPSEALVLRFEKEVKDFNMPLKGRSGMDEHIIIAATEGYLANGHVCAVPEAQAGDTELMDCTITFGGDSRITHMMPLLLPPRGGKGGKFTSNFTIPQKVFDQLEARNKKYPIQWQSTDNATWLMPGHCCSHKVTSW